MNHHDRCQRCLRRYFADDPENFHLVLWVECAGRLVQKQGFGFLCQRTSDIHLLPFAAGKLIAIAVDKRFELQPFDGCCYDSAVILGDAP